MPKTENLGTAIVTGGSKRLGKCTAEALHKIGYNLLVHYGNSETEARILENELNNIRPDSCQCIQADLASTDGIDQILDYCHSLGNDISLLVNNASAFYPTNIGELDDEKWQHLMGTNVRAPLFLSQGLAPSIASNEGCIVNLVDIYSERPLAKHPIYNISKAGIHMLTKTLALELAPNVRVNGVSPGAILWPEQNESEDYQKRIISKIPLGRSGSPDDIARTVVFLAQSPYISGQVIQVDGGRSLNM